MRHLLFLIPLVLGCQGDLRNRIDLLEDRVQVLEQEVYLLESDEIRSHLREIRRRQDERALQEQRKKKVIVLENP